MIPVADPVLQIALDRGLLPREHPGASGQPARVVIDPEALARAVAAEFGMPYVVLSGLTVPAEVLAALPRSFVEEHKVMPYAREGGALCVALADPVAVDVIADLGAVAGGAIRPALAAADDLAQAIARHYGRPAESLERLLDAETGAFRQDPADGAAGSEAEEGSAAGRDAPIIRLVQAIIADAVRRRASDIHLEPLERRFRVRHRIDGVLIEADAPPRRLQPAIITRLKIMANISIAEKRVPQDGRIQVTVDGRNLDLRVSTLPTVHGESIVMRILDREGLKPGMSELGFLPDDQQQFERLIASPDGIVLVTGPTGSGKTTTLYASLHHLNRPDRKIVTVEDPVEYQLAGINQVPVNAGIGMTCAAALRALLRQAPNIVMVGEIRDAETAGIALNAALTGHMVFSTLHTNDAPSAVTRLIDLGARPFLVAASLRAAMAQRLVRRICPRCRRAYTPSVRELHALGLTAGQSAGAEFLHGAGCADCNGTGYRGRLGIFEIFLVQDGIRGMIHDQAPAARLREQARRDGMRTMRADGIRKVLAGLTTIEEVVSVTVGDTP